MGSMYHRLFPYLIIMSECCKQLSHCQQMKTKFWYILHIVSILVKIDNKNMYGPHILISVWLMNMQTTHILNSWCTHMFIVYFTYRVLHKSVNM
jgi:hypothetical protein